MNKIKRFIKDERGFSALLFAVMMPVFLALAGVVLDGGLMMYSKAKLEAATEAAALSTIAAYDEEIWDEYEEVVLDEYIASLYAEYYLQVNLPEATLISCVVDPSDPSQAILTTEITVPTVFARIYGVNEKTLITQATSHGG